MEILDGRKISKIIQEEIREEVQEIRKAGKRPPHLVAILIGDNPASNTYVKNKMRSCEYVGFNSTKVHLSDNITEEELLHKVRIYNDDPGTDGILVQMPLPEHITPHRITQEVTLNFPGIISATPAGVLELIDRYDIETKGKHCVVVGRSRIVGRPMSILMSRGGKPGEATVTICHKYTPPEELKRICPQADILLVAVGKPGLITADMVKEGAVVIDVGITRVPDESKKSGFRLSGDVDFENVAPKTSFITPVPGGVGPMTVSMLLKNTLDAYKRRMDD